MPSGVDALRRSTGVAYRQIAREIRRRISNGEFVTDGRLPTEDVLMQEYSVSRHTVRAALAVLVSDGVVVRYAGRGTFVAGDRGEPNSWSIRSLEDIVNETFPVDPKLLEIAWLDASDEREAAEALDLDEEDTLLRITAMRMGVDGVLACSQIFVPQEVGSRIASKIEKNLGRQPVVRLIEEQATLLVGHARQVMTMRTPPPMIAEALEEPAEQMTIAFLRTYTSTDGAPVEFSRLYGKPGRFSSTIEFSRQETG